MSDALRTQFEEAGQGHVFRFFDDLSPDQQAQLLQQAGDIDLAELDELVQTLVLAEKSGSLSLDDVEPAPFIPLPTNGGEQTEWDAAFAKGEEALKAGRVAAFTVAGGQGTRLGFDGPKGTFPVTPVTKKTLFQVFAEKILASSRHYGKPIPWFIMTSVINHEATVAFFEEHDFFGLDPKDVTFFSQGLMPAVDLEGKIILESPDFIALSPDGHGGSLRALVRNGCVQAMKDRGIDLVSYFQVDNPLVRCVDPAFIGFHLLGESELSSKACLKAYAGEKVGVFVKRGENVEVLEYSDMPDSMSEATDETGTLLYQAGSIAIHIFCRDLIEKIGEGKDASVRLPFHRANKKVPTINDAGEAVKPDSPNGVKFETFVFDALPFAKNPVVIQTAREDDFSPVKNAEGNDSPETSRQDQLRQFARWVKAAGLELAVDETGLPAFDFEISPLFADSEAQFVARKDEAKIEAGTVLG